MTLYNSTHMKLYVSYNITTAITIKMSKRCSTQNLPEDEIQKPSQII